MSDLAEWLLACIAEDEADARDRRGVWPDPTVMDDGAVVLNVQYGGNAVIVWYRNPVAGYGDMAALRTWAEPAGGGWHRDRVLAECEAKRSIVELATTAERMIEGEWSGYGPENEGWLILASMALPYADRPGFREEWQL